VLEEPAKPTAGWMQLKLQDLPAVWESHTPFARSVDLSSRPEVAAAIDEVVDGRRLSTAPGDPPKPLRTGLVHELVRFDRVYTPNPRSRSVIDGAGA
jgi:hypothetical protein